MRLYSSARTVRGRWLEGCYSSRASGRMPDGNREISGGNGRRHSTAGARRSRARTRLIISRGEKATSRILKTSDGARRRRPRSFAKRNSRSVERAVLAEEEEEEEGML